MEDDGSGKPYRVEALSFATRDEAKAWMIAHQLGRRNLPENVIAYYRGQYKALLQDIAKASGLPGRSGPVFMAQHSEKVQVVRHDVAQPTPFIAIDTSVMLCVRIRGLVAEPSRRARA